MFFLFRDNRLTRFSADFRKGYVFVNFILQEIHSEGEMKNLWEFPFLLCVPARISHHYMPCFQPSKFGKKDSVFPFGFIPKHSSFNWWFSLKLNTVTRVFLPSKGWKLERCFILFPPPPSTLHEGRKIWPGMKERPAALTNIRRFSQSPMLHAAGLLHVWYWHDFWQVTSDF